MTPAENVRAKLQTLNALRLAIRPGSLDNLDRIQRIDITYTSNAIEGNTLTAGETALILEKGLTIGGKPLKDHLEAIDHARALDWVLEMSAESDNPIVEADIRNLHRLVMGQSEPHIAGRYADTARYVNTVAGMHHFPEPINIPALMEAFCRWLGATENAPETAFKAHLDLVDIHPFNDGNGRTARLLMNLILSRAGYPVIAIRPDDRATYLLALETAQASREEGSFYRLLFDRLDKTLDTYINAAREAQDVQAVTALKSS